MIYEKDDDGSSVASPPAEPDGMALTSTFSPERGVGSHSEPRGAGGERRRGRAMIGAASPR